MNLNVLCVSSAAVEGVLAAAAAARAGRERGAAAGAVPGGVAVHGLRQGHAAGCCLQGLGPVPPGRRCLPLQYCARYRLHTITNF